MLNREDDATWNRVEDIYIALHTALIGSHGGGASDIYLSGTLRFLEHLLDDPMQRLDSHAFAIVSDLLCTTTYIDEVWEWLKHALCGANDNRRSALMVMLGVPLTEEPVQWDDSKQVASMAHLLGCSRDP